MSRVQQNEAESEALRKAKREQELADIKHVMSTREGRRLIWRMLRDAKIFNACFTGNSRTFYLLGRKEHMLKYFNDIMEACPDLFMKMQAENINQSKED